MVQCEHEYKCIHKQRRGKFINIFILCSKCGDTKGSFIKIKSRLNDES